ncbi:hypothetical protein [Vibrio phage VP4B]|uniref:Uncharacterized protein n=1 Tax=Vibrio phage VP4B TaxID=1262540 RepID=V9M0N8_9CAUD|nr:virion structural protein [Vibrio phage VP4B]AGB07223.1 hypothetical protein [Vibrio phage VP4B]
MSHLNHILKLNSKLVDQGITNPEHHQSVTTNAVVRAIVAYTYITGGIDGPAMTNEAVAQMERTVEMWNEVSPLDYDTIFERTKAVFQRLYNQAVAGGKFTPILADQIDDIDLMEIPEFESTFKALLNEMIAYNR